MPQEILPPPETPNVPDRETKLGLPDQTGKGAADGRVMHVNLGFFKFGTDDKAQAVAFILTVLMLGILTALAIWGQDTDQAKAFAGLLEKAVLITIGVAVGQSIGRRKD